MPRLTPKEWKKRVIVALNAKYIGGAAFIKSLNADEYEDEYGRVDHVLRAAFSDLQPQE